MPPEAAPLMKATGVDAGYGTMQVLWGVDLDVRPGETVLLLGANGAGKTTFLKSLVGLIDARGGSITLADTDITRMRSSDRMRLGMTYMSELAVFPDLSIEENIRVGLSPLFVKEVIRILSDLQGRGLALLIAEQNIGFLEVATRVFVLEGGRIRFSGTVAEMTDNEALRRAYFGLK